MTLLQDQTEKAKTRYIWKKEEALNPLKEDSQLETLLKWPTGTLAVLRSAFEKKLTRNCEWDLNSISSAEAHKAAARYYMRGAACSAPLENEDICQFLIAETPDLEFTSLLKSNFVICDENVLNAWPELLGKNVDCVLHNVNESKKTLSSVAKILKASEAFPNSSWLIIGGGITCDLAAFAAHLAGVDFRLAPTTLLAMIDASIGGKTGVNFPPHGKNLIGAFAFPKQVLIFTDFLKTLPIEEFYSGACEGVKHAILGRDPQILDQLSTAFADRNMKTIREHLPYLLEVKAQIVQRDPFENGERAILNLGHTLAHALESVSLDSISSEPLRHGEAVGVGLVFESQLSVDLGYRSHSDHETLLKLLQKSNCLLDRSRLESRLSYNLDSQILLDKLCYHLQFDKKTQDPDRIPFILLAHDGAIARPDLNSWLVHIPVSRAREAWKRFAEFYPLISSRSPDLRSVHRQTAQTL